MKIVKYYKLDGKHRVDIPVDESLNFGMPILYTPGGWAVDAGLWKPHEEIELMMKSDQKWFTFFFPKDLFCLTSMFDSDNTFLGHAIDLVSNVEDLGDFYKVIDLELDIWVSNHGDITLLDMDEFEDMISAGYISPQLASDVRNCADRILEKCGESEFPKNIIEDKFLNQFPSDTF